MILATPFPDFPLAKCSVPNSAFLLCGFPKSLSHPVKKMLILENKYKKT